MSTKTLAELQKETLEENEKNIDILNEGEYSECISDRKNEKMRMKKKTSPRSIRLPEDIREKIKREALLTERSETRMIVFILRKYFKSKEKGE